MRGFDEFKERMLNDEVFAESFASIKMLEDVVEIAEKQGYEFTVEELQDDEMSDDILEAVAGGSGQKDSVNYH